jgi:hypothetical protein
MRNLKRNYAEEYAQDMTEQLKERYNKETSSGYFGNSKPSDSQKRLTEIAVDLQWLIELYSDNQAINNMSSYKLMKRVLSEQCEIKEGKLELKASKEISSDSLQNPSDIDAGYDSHKGQGYQVQLSETYSRKEEEGADKSKGELVLDLITYVKVESADNHDSRALQPAITEMEERGIKPEEMLVDAAYGGDDNVMEAKAMQVEIVSPVTGKKSGKDFTGFEFEDRSKVVKQCPGGRPPRRVVRNKKGKITAIWPKEDCMNCPLRDNCHTKNGAKGRRLIYTPKDIRLWERRQYEVIPEFNDKYRYRAGIEGTNARYIHMTGARRVRYRGQENVEFAETIKALGINMFRVAKYIRNKGLSIAQIANSALIIAFLLIFGNLKNKARLIYEKYSAKIFWVDYLSRIAYF